MPKKKAVPASEMELEQGLITQQEVSSNTGETNVDGSAAESPPEVETSTAEQQEELLRETDTQKIPEEMAERETSPEILGESEEAGGAFAFEPAEEDGTQHWPMQVQDLSDGFTTEILSVKFPDVQGTTEATIYPSEEVEEQQEKNSYANESPAEPVKSDRQRFYELDFRELDRHLTLEERQEWNSIYASYRGHSALSGTITGVDHLSVVAYNAERGRMEQQEMYCAIVVPYRVRIVIPETEMWDNGNERPSFVLQSTVGAHIDFIVTKVDREGGFAVASRRQTSRIRRIYFSRRPALHSPGARIPCRVLAVGPRRCLVECYGHDINLTQRDLRYTAIPDLRTEYHPGQELACLVKVYNQETDTLEISVKETEPNPYDGAELRHPVGCRRQAKIAGKYGGGVFCNLSDGTVCMCNYSYRYTDSDFMTGDTVILVVQRFDHRKKQMYGKILSKW